jgi:two-component system, LytTR family, response regulator LytT
MTAIILDTNESDTHNLCALLNEGQQEIHVSHQFNNLASFNEFWVGTTIKIDVIFMDIFFDSINIFEQIDVIKLCTNVIITTHQEDFAAKAFRKNVTDFLLKPIQMDQLLESIEKAKKMMTLAEKPKTSKYKSHFQVSMGKQIINIKIDDIDYIESSNKMTYIHLICGKRIPSIIPLIELENMLDPNIFFRANRQVIFHFDAIQSIEKYKSSKFIVRLKSNIDKVVSLSDEKSKVFKTWMDR